MKLAKPIPNDERSRKRYARPPFFLRIEETLRGLYAWRDSLKQHPVWGTLLAIGILIGGVASEAYGYLKSKWSGPDEFLAQMAESHAREFEALKTSLGNLERALPPGEKETLKNIQDSIRTLERTNQSLLQQLATAKREIASLSELAAQRTGITGGYDFSLAPGEGIRLDATTSFGLTTIYNNARWVSVNLTSRDQERAKQADLQSGQSLPYKDNAGRRCKVAVQTITGGSATFAIVCEEGKAS